MDSNKPSIHRDPAGLRAESHRLLLACVLLSGIAGLVYEVVWARQLVLFLGTTTYAHTAVLTAYMAGLALGSYVVGGVADRSDNPLRLYALFEIGIGLFALTTPWSFTLLQKTYLAVASHVGFLSFSSYGLRFALACAALMIPTFLMGGTLPLLVRGTEANPDRVSRSTARLYGVNTLGATLGAFAAGYLLLPSLGIHGTIMTAVVMNIAVGITVYFAFPESQPTLRTGSRIGGGDTKIGVAGLDGVRARWLLIGFGVSGFTALVYQLAWIRSLILVIGGSVYAFSLTLTAFLSSLAIGSLAYQRLANKFTTLQALRCAAFLQLGVCLTALATLALIGELPRIFLDAFQKGVGERFLLFHLFLFGISFLVVFTPTLMLGALFPLITGLWSQSTHAVGRGVGTAYSANAIGTILGSIAGGLLLLPLLGIEHTIFVASGLSASIATLYWCLAVQASSQRIGGAALALALFAIGVCAVPNWNRLHMQSGVYAGPQLFRDSIDMTWANWELVYYEEGVDAIVSVLAMSDSDRRSLRINGKADAGSGGDMPTQILVGHLPIFMHPHPKRSLVIGLGSGVTAGAVAAHESIRELDIVEIVQEVVEASEFFVEPNHGVLSDPRTRLIIADARNFLMAGGEPYDVIISEPSNPWISSVAHLFTLEHLTLARDRLAPDGVMAHWVQTYSMSIEDVKTLIKTFSAVFDHVSAWLVLGRDLILIGSRNPHSLDYDRVQSSLETPRLRDDLEIGEIRSVSDLLNYMLMNDDHLDRFVEHSPLNTDARPRIEFSAPFNLYRRTIKENESAFSAHIATKTFGAPAVGLVSASGGRLRAPFINLLIKADANRGALIGAHAEWKLTRPEIEGSHEEGLHHELTKHGRVTWKQGGASYRVEADERDSWVTRNALRNAIREALDQHAVTFGDVQLSGGQQGAWMAGPAATSGRIEIGIGWQCALNRWKQIRYIAIQERDDLGDMSWEQAVEDFAKQLACISD